MASNFAPPAGALPTGPPSPTVALFPLLLFFFPRDFVTGAGAVVGNSAAALLAAPEPGARAGFVVVAGTAAAAGAVLF